MHDKLLRTDEVAVILDITADRVATMARERLLPAIRCGRSWRFAPADSGNGWSRVALVAGNDFLNPQNDLKPAVRSAHE
jgi:excisionase family DNA binding protein